MQTHEKVKQARSTMKDLRGQKISLGRVKVSLGAAGRALSVVPGFKHLHPGKSYEINKRSCKFAKKQW